MADNSFWNKTFQQHGSSVLAFIASRVGRREVAEDLLQETFVRAMRWRAELPDPDQMRSYLFTTAYHLVVDQRRQTNRRERRELSTTEERPLEDWADPDPASPETALDLERLGRRLTDTLADLPAAHRTAFEHAVLAQRPYAEVAAEQGWTLEQVKINVYRARKTVIERLRRTLRARPEVRK